MASVLFTVRGVIMNALALNSSIFSSASLEIMVKKNAKDVVLYLKGFKGQEINVIKIE